MQRFIVHQRQYTLQDGTRAEIREISVIGERGVCGCVSDMEVVQRPSSSSIRLNGSSRRNCTSSLITCMPAFFNQQTPAKITRLWTLINTHSLSLSSNANVSWGTLIDDPYGISQSWPSILASRYICKHHAMCLKVEDIF